MSSGAEGFLCPNCKRELPTPDKLAAHFEEVRASLCRERRAPRSNVPLKRRDERRGGRRKEGEGEGERERVGEFGQSLTLERLAW